MSCFIHFKSISVTNYDTSYCVTADRLLFSQLMEAKFCGEFKESSFICLRGQRFYSFKSKDECESADIKELILTNKMEIQWKKYY